MSWYYKKLLVCHIIIAVIIVSYFIPFTRILWDAMDHSFFHLLNNSLRGNPTWQLFWAIFNHKLADWLHDVVILILILAAIFTVRKEERVKKTAEFLFILLYVACIIYFVNRVFFRKYVDIERLSPTLVFPDSVKLSREITWIGIKDSSRQSFPGDHATTALFFTVTYAYYANRNLAFIGCLYGIFMCLPRIVTGAHWLSDVIMGSGSIVLFFLSWAFYSPFGGKTIDLISRFLTRVLDKPLYEKRRN